MGRTGMIIDGILGSECVDSSGEILDVAGADISDLEEGRGVLDYEHQGADEKNEKGEYKSQGQEIVGKIVSAKKVMKESDCDNSRERMYWQKVKHPFIYGICRLYDGAGHEGAKALAAQIRDHHANGEPILVRFSVEGSTLEKDGNILKRSVIRRVALTLKPCNRTATSGLLEDPHAPQGFDKKPISETKDLLASLADDTKKMEHSHPAYQKLGGTTETEYVEFTEVDGTALIKALAKLKTIKKAIGRPTDFPSDLENDIRLLGEEAAWRKAVSTVGTKVRHSPPKPLKEDVGADLPLQQPGGPLSGATTFDVGTIVRPAKDPVNGRGADGMALVEHDLDGQPVQRWYSALHLDPHQDEAKVLQFPGVRKTLTAGSGDVAPSSLTGGAALSREDIIKFKPKAMTVLKTFLGKHREFERSELVAFMKQEMPEVSDSFIGHFADIADDYRLKLRKDESKKPAESPYPKLNPEIGGEIAGPQPRVDISKEPKGAFAPKIKGGLEMQTGGKTLLQAKGAGKGQRRVSLQQHFPDDKLYHSLLKPDEGLAAGVITPEQHALINKTIHEPWHRAMSNWLPLNKALSEGKVPKSIIAKSVIFAAMSPNCLDYKTEALTQRGWVPGFSLRADDVLLTKNPTTLELEWQPLLDLRLFPDYEGDLVEIKSRSFNVVTTPEHRWLVTTNRGHVREKTSETLVVAEKIHRTGCFRAPESSRLTPDEAELLGWFVTDGFIRRPSPGSTTKRLRVFLVQSPKANREKCDRIQALLERLAPGEFGRYQYSEEKCNWYVGKRLTDLLVSLCPDRTLRVENLVGLDREALRRLQESMVLGDGSCQDRNGWTTRQVLATGRAEQASAFQALLVLNGFASNSTNRDMSGYKPQSDKLKNVPRMTTCWYVSKSERKFYRVDSKHIRRYRAKVPVWCPVVANTFFVARRLGQVFITGNTSVPNQERYYGYYMDMLNEGKVDPFKPMSEAHIQEFTKRSTSGELPQWNREYYEAHPPGEYFGEKISEDADKGELPQILGLRNAHKLFPYLEHLTAKHRDDTQQIAAELMDMKHEQNKAKLASDIDRRNGRTVERPPLTHERIIGFGPKLTRYMLCMYGGGNMIVPDRHMVRSTFDLHMDHDAEMLEKLQTSVVTKAHNEPFLRAIDHNFFVKHPAVKQVLETFPKHFAGREQQAIFPAFWLHWLTIGHYDKMRGRPSMAFNTDTDHQVFWDSVRDEMVKHGLHPHPIYDGRVHSDAIGDEDDSFNFGHNVAKSEGTQIDPWPRHHAVLDHPTWLKAAGCVEALRQRWGEMPALFAFFTHVLPKLNAAETPVPPVTHRPHPAYHPNLFKMEGLLINLRKAVAEVAAGDDRSLADIAPHIHNVYTYKVGPDNRIKRHVSGRFTTAGNHVHFLEDYHDDLKNNLSEGFLDGTRQQQIQNLKLHPKLDVASLHEINSGSRPELWQPLVAQGTTAKPSIFKYVRQGQSAPDHLEFVNGYAHLNGHQLARSQVQALLQHVKNGHASVHYPEHGEVIRKMEEVFETILKADDSDSAPIHEALGRLDELVRAGHLEPHHAQALRAHAFTDPMTGNVMGNKLAYTDFKSRNRGGIHLMLDGNDFKAINDRFGHETGDHAIRAMAGALKSAIDEAAPGEGKLFRVGGDEFAAHLPTHEHAARFARTLRQKLEAVPPVQGVHKLSMGIGIGTSPEHADTALYEAKKQKYDPAGMIGPDSRKWVSKYAPGSAPTLAHSLVPGFEGAIPLDHSQLHLRPPPAPEPRPPAPEPVLPAVQDQASHQTKAA